MKRFLSVIITVLFAGAAAFSQEFSLLKSAEAFKARMASESADLADIESDFTQIKYLILHNNIVQVKMAAVAR